MRWLTRARVFASLVFRPWALGGVVAVDEADIVTTRLTLVGTSAQRFTLAGTSAERLTARGPAGTRLDIEGSSS